MDALFYRLGVNFRLARALAATGWLGPRIQLVSCTVGRLIVLDDASTMLFTVPRGDLGPIIPSNKQLTVTRPRTNWT